MNLRAGILLTLICMFFNIFAQTTTTEIGIDFRAGKCNVDSTYRDNATELARLNDVISLINSNPNVSVSQIEINGYASPEGTQEVNRRLSEQRITALEQYIRSRLTVADSVVVRHPGAIPWCRLTAAISTSDDAGLKRMLEVLSSDSSVVEYLPGRHADRRAYEIQKLPAYRKIYRSVFPSLRRAEAVISTVETQPESVPEPVVEPEPTPEPVPADTVAVVAEPEPVVEPLDADGWTRGLYLKTNAVGWALLVSNIAVEVDINERWSVTVPVYYSALDYGTRLRKLRTLAVLPEVRWWFAPKWFAGAHFGYAQYNYALKSSDWRYQDHNGNTPALGGGVSLGWRTPLGKSRHWMLELTAGAGCYRLKYDKFHNEPNGAMVSTTSRTFFGVDNAAVTIVYRFDLKNRRR